MTRRLLPALALSLFVALPSTAFAGPAPLHPAPGDAPASFKGVPGALAKKKKSKKKKRKADPKAPVVKKISPRRAKVGDLLVVTGKNFLKGKGKNRVVFYTLKGGAVFARDAGASAKRLKVRIPDKLAALLPANGDQARILLRVRGKRLGKRSTTRISPLVSIRPGQVGGGNPGTGGPVGCTPKPGDPASDVDRDLLSDGLETNLALNACNRDSDGDGASDGYEWHSSRHLNSEALPYPWKRPYPNALFKDSNVDYDGDGLTTWDEYSLWTKFQGGALPLSYSDGKQATLPVAAPADPALWYIDMDGNGMLSDDERDEDGDGLGNWDESVQGRMQPAWWEAKYDGNNGPLETPYPITFAGTNMLDPDTDGDTLVDGADDNDFDGLTNRFELNRPFDWQLTYISTGPGTNWHNWDGVGPVDPDPVTAGDQSRYYSRVQPFNPCKPVFSARCHLHPPFGHYPPDEDWMGAKNAPPKGARPGDV